MSLKYESDGLPSVAGDRMERSIADHTQACRVLIAQELEKPNADNALIAVLCDAVRLAREYSWYAVEATRQTRERT